jgi:hypothetical protein
MGEIVSRLAAFLLYAALQGFLLAALARAMGDRRPQHDGRLSLNPFVHLSVWGAAFAALFAVSWVRSIWYDAAQSRLGRYGAALVTFLGLAAMVVLVALIDLLQPLVLLLPRTGSYAVLYVLDQLQLIAMSSVLLNLLPGPGLVGGGFLQALWPNAERRLRQAEPICVAIVMAIVVALGFPDPTTMGLPLLSIG